jgi:methylase of polypeptide subunit release factors
LLLEIKALPNNFLICANLPYLSKNQLREQSIKHEPKLALYGGKKSEDLIVRLLEQIKNKVTGQPKLRGTILLEIDPGQIKIIKKAALKLLPKNKFTAYKDLNNFERMVQIEI